MSLADQISSGFSLAEKLPTCHYARKNIGYLHAIRSGAECIYETDDDNAPMLHWAPRDETVSNIRKIESVLDCQDGHVSDFCSRWINVYRYFTDEHIWPRGFPLDQIHTLSNHLPYSPDSRSNQQSPTVPLLCTSVVSLSSPIQQGLVNGSPDVDAIWRLTLDRPFMFDNRPSVYLSPGNWCPFNTQSTWWWPVAYPLLYIPSYCSFRMCDIWKSFIAQRCLWAMGFGVVFHAPEVFQERNQHNLMKDFEDEVPGYLNNARIADVLEKLSLDSGFSNVGKNLRTCYAALVKEGFFPEEELALVDCWCRDLEAIHG